MPVFYGRGGIRTPEPEGADLQSAAFSLFATLPKYKQMARDGIEPPTHALDWNEIAVEITNMICVFISLLYHLSYLAMWHVLLICKDVCAIALIGESWI